MMLDASSTNFLWSAPLSKSIFVGYSESVNKPYYKLYNTAIGKLFVSRNVAFLEDQSMNYLKDKDKI